MYMKNVHYKFKFLHIQCVYETNITNVHSYAMYISYVHCIYTLKMAIFSFLMYILNGHTKCKAELSQAKLSQAKPSQA